jgi:POT family proton-dependent oligopeptide transporter
MSFLSLLQRKLNQHPRGLYVLFYTEMWELFGRFGITALLVFYLTNHFHLSDALAFSVYSGFIALMYVMPIVGGYFSDRFLGLPHAILLGAGLMAVGNAMLVVTELNFVYLGLTLVAVGSGFFLPSIVPLVGRLYQEDRRGRDAGFTVYYIGKNIGALLAPLLCGLVAQRYGYNYAFILSTLGMLSGIVVFVRGQKHLKPVEAEVAKPVSGWVAGLDRRLKSGGAYLVALLSVPIMYAVLRYRWDGYLLAFSGLVALVVLLAIALRHGAQTRRHLLLIVIMMVFVVIFSAFLGQGGTTLNLFIERIVDRHIFDFQMPPSFFYSLDPVFMIVLGSFLAGFWAYLSKRGLEPSEIFKFMIAMLLLALGFAVFVMAAKMAQLDGRASAWFVVLAYAIFPLAELTIMPIGLSLVTRLSPKNHDALMVGIWMLGYSVSGYLTGIISLSGQVQFPVQHLAERQHAAGIYLQDFSLSSICLLAAAVLLLILVPVFRYLVRAKSDQRRKVDEIYY